jgi:hypothetical protein
MAPEHCFESMDPQQTNPGRNNVDHVIRRLHRAPPPRVGLGEDERTVDYWTVTVEKN